MVCRVARRLDRDETMPSSARRHKRAGGREVAGGKRRPSRSAVARTLRSPQIIVETPSAAWGGESTNGIDGWLSPGATTVSSTSSRARSRRSTHPDRADPGPPHAACASRGSARNTFVIGMVLRVVPTSPTPATRTRGASIACRCPCSPTRRARRTATACDREHRIDHPAAERDHACCVRELVLTGPPVAAAEHRVRALVGRVEPPRREASPTDVARAPERADGNWPAPGPDRNIRGSCARSRRHVPGHLASTPRLERG